MSESQKTEKNPDKQPENSKSRRSFLKIIWAGLGIIAAAEFIAVILSFLNSGRSAKKQDRPEAVIEVGKSDSFLPGSVTASIQGKFYLVRMKDGGFLALSSKCTHLGCTVPWIDEEGKFICPCHRSSFDITGNVISSPAPRPLDVYSVFIENNTVKVDISRAIKRERFSKKHVVYAEKVI